MDHADRKAYVASTNARQFCRSSRSNITPSAILDRLDPCRLLVSGLAGLRGALEAAVPMKDGAHLLIGTWNIRAFGLTPK